MHYSYFNKARQLGNEDLLNHVAHLARQSRSTTAELIAHLAEVDARKLHAAAGYSSLFVYCCEVLLLSEYGAYNRIVAARAAQRFPLILDLLAEGALNVATVRLLAPHLTSENHLALLRSARGLRKHQVEKLVAGLAPKPDVPETIRKIPAARTVPQRPIEAAGPMQSALPTSPSTSPTPIAARHPEPAVTIPLSPERYKMQLTIGGDTLEMFDVARDLLRHTEPSGSAEAILKRALGALLDDLLKKKVAATDQPQPGREPTKGSRTVPAEVQRAVYLRDRGRCAYVAANGRRCHERAFVEFHHVDPYAWGGRAVVDKIELRCATHNAYEWQREYTALRIEEYEWQERQLLGAG